jgi:hypothetical protein
MSVVLTAIMLLAMLTPLNASANTNPIVVSPTPLPGGTIQSNVGSLTLGETPLANITFSLYNTETNVWYDFTSNENGNFTYALPNGTYKIDGVWVDPTWYVLGKTFTVTNGLVDGKPLTIDALDYQIPTDDTANVLGTVQNGTQPLSHLTFSIHSTDGTWYDAKTDKNGQFAFELPDGSYVVDGIWDQASEKWYELNQIFTVADGELQGSTELLIDIATVASDNVFGTLTKGSDALSNLTFSVRTAAGDEKWYSATTDANGNYSLRLPDGDYQLEGIWNSSESKWYVLNKTFTVADNLQLDINVFTDGPADLTPNVTGVLKKGMETLTNVVFSVHTTTGDETWYDITSDEEGNFSAQLPDGSYMLDGIWLATENKWYELKQEFTVDGTYELTIDVLAAEPPAGDVTAPVIDMPHFGVHAVSPTSLEYSMKVNEEAKAYYVLLSENADVPSKQQVKEGKNRENQPALKASTITLVADQRTVHTINGLTASTKYKLVTFMEDASGNATDLHVFLPTTLAEETTPPPQEVVEGSISFIINSTLGTNTLPMNNANVSIVQLSKMGSNHSYRVQANTSVYGNGLKVEVPNLDKTKAPTFYALINTNGYLLIEKFTAEEIGAGVVKTISIDEKYAPLEFSIAGLTDTSIQDSIILSVTNETKRGIFTYNLQQPGLKIPFGTYHIQYVAERDDRSYSLFKTDFAVSATNHMVSFTEEDMAKVTFNINSSHGVNYLLEHVGPSYQLGLKFNSITHPNMEPGVNSVYFTKGSYNEISANYIMEKNQEFWDIAFDSNNINLQGDRTITIEDELLFMVDWQPEYISSKTINMEQKLYTFFDSSIMNRHFLEVGNFSKVEKNQWGWYSTIARITGKLTIKANNKEYSKEVNVFTFTSLSIKDITGGEVLSGQVEMIFEAIDSPIPIIPYREFITIQ